MNEKFKASFYILRIQNSLYLQQQHPFNGLFSRTTWVSWYWKGGTILDFNEARHDGVVIASAGSCANHLHFTPDR